MRIYIRAYIYIYMCTYIDTKCMPAPGRSSSPTATALGGHYCPSPPWPAGRQTAARHCQRRPLPGANSRQPLAGRRWQALAVEQPPQTAGRPAAAQHPPRPPADMLPTAAGHRQQGAGGHCPQPPEGDRQTSLVQTLSKLVLAVR